MRCRLLTQSFISKTVDGSRDCCIVRQGNQASDRIAVGRRARLDYKRGTQARRYCTSDTSKICGETCDRWTLWLLLLHYRSRSTGAGEHVLCIGGWKVEACDSSESVGPASEHDDRQTATRRHRSMSLLLAQSGRRECCDCSGPLLAQNGHPDTLNRCPVSGVKRTSVLVLRMPVPLSQCSIGGQGLCGCLRPCRPAKWEAREGRLPF
jgi:hypothetical protein